MGTRARRRRLTWTAVALALLLGSGYAYVARPGALRSWLADLLGRFDLRVVRIGDISFSPTAGLEVLDLEVAANEGSPLAGPAELPDRPLLRVPRARVRASPWMLLLGRFQPREVELDTPAIAVIWPEGEQSRSSSPRLTGLPVPPRATPAGLPRLRINRADIEVFALEDGQLHLRRRWVVDGRGALSGGDESEPRAYVLRFDQVGGVASAKHTPGAALVQVRLQAGRLIAELGWVDLEVEQPLIPEGWTELVRRLRLAGQVRARRIVLDATGLASAEIECDRLRSVIPVETDVGDPETECFARLTNAAGTLAFERSARETADGSAGLRGHVKLRLAGRLNDAAATVELCVDDIAHRPRAGAGVEERTVADVLDDLEFGPYRMDMRVDGLTLPTLKDAPRFVTSEQLPEALRSWIRKYDAEGRVNLSVVLDGDGSKEDLRYQGAIEALDGSCRYFRFPYRIADARGLVRFSNDGIVFEGLHGRHGADRIRLDGRLADSTSWTAFELSFRGHNVVSDAELYAALPPKYQALWRSAAPVGLWDVQVRLERQHGSAQAGSYPTDVRVDARLLSGSLELHDGSVLENADGLVHIAEGRVELDDLHGYLDGALVRVSGTLESGPSGESPLYDVHVEVADSRLQRTSEVRDGEGRFIGQFEFEGVGDVWGQLSSEERGQSHYVVNITDGVLTGFEGRQPWRRAAGWISLRGDEQRIHSLTAQREGGSLSIAGTLPAELGLHSPIVLDLRGTDENLERVLRELVPGRWSNIREALGLAGAGTLTARFHPQALEGANEQQAAEILLEAERMRPTPLPLDLCEIQARLTLHAAGFELHEATARYGPAGRVTVGGRGGWSGGSTWTDISAEAWDLELDGELVQAMPGPLAAFLTRMAPRGRMQLKLDQVLLNGTERRVWNVVGRIVLDDAQLNVGLPLTEFAGHLDGRCEIRPEGWMDLDAEFAIERGRLAERPIERWEGRIVRRPDAGRVRLEDVRGRLCDGELVGFAEIDPDTSTYELSFTLHGVDLDQFLRPKENKPARAARGRLDGHIFVRGSTDDPAERSGGGEFRVRGTSLLSSPVTASVVEASRQQDRSISEEVERAEV
ncbi:MAG: hypothetical protein KKI02_05395, partial [Planctomycetes bacterium]|nr:hypothetical protein [Planctomycetota bacterium]